MTLIKTSLLNGIAVIIKMLTLLGINKILAIYVGPSGYAALGQFQNAVQMISTFASGAINTGVTKYTAEYHEDVTKQQAVWRTAGTISFIGSVVTGMLVVIFRDTLSGWFLNDENYRGVFVWFALALVFFVFNTLLLAILNGKKEIHRYVVANISGSLFALLATAVMTMQYGLYGALVSLAVYQSLAFFVTILLCYKAKWFKFNYLFGAIDKATALNLGKFTAMALTSAACVPLSHILVRNHLGETLSWEAAGYWEAMSRLSGAYLLLITTTLSVYYLPRLSEIKSSGEIKNEIAQGYRVILPAAVVLGLIIYLFRDLIIQVLFTMDFLPMRELFALQLVGDTLKIGSWVLGYVMLGRALVKLFVISEIIFSFSFVALTYSFTSYMGLEGVSLAHALNYLLYWFFVGYFLFKKKQSI
ncbi:O-antigen translocase [Pseudomonadaceae bacterium T75]|nr:O-antigen translocase [Pseudomonadaceae bacterium T75]